TRRTQAQAYSLSFLSLGGRWFTSAIGSVPLSHSCSFMRKDSRGVLTGKGLLADAKPAEDPVEQVVGVNGPGHLAELVQGAAQLQGQQLRRVLTDHQGVRPPQLPDALLDVMPAAAQARRQRRLTTPRRPFRQQRPQLVE